MVLVLLGMKHSGKSSIAPILAKCLGGTWLDLDDEIEKMYGKKEQGEFLSPREIYKREGEKGFRDLEAQAMRQVLPRSHPPATSPLTSPAGREDSPLLVIATGGGLGDNPKALVSAESAAYRIYIDTPSEILYKRVLRRGLPAYLSGEHPYEDFLAIHRRRDRGYRKIANLILRGDEKTPVEISDEIVHRIRQRGKHAG